MGSPLLELNILIINPPTTPDLQVNRDFMGGFGATNVKGVTKVPSLMAEYVTGMLRHNGFNADILDLAVESNPQEAENKIKDVRIIGLYCGTATFKEDLKFADRIKECTGAFIFMFGPQVSVTPDYAMVHSDIDALIIGEPEYTSLEIVTNLQNNISDLSRINGLWWKKEGEIIKSPSRQLEKDLDRFPFPYRNLKYIDKYFYRVNEVPFITILSSRGCPYNCIYCPYPVSQGTEFRCRSPLNVIEELQNEKNRFPYKMILFRDPVFTFQKKRTIELCRLLKERINVPWRCETTCINVDDDLLDIMKASGCIGINFGIETGSPKLIKKYALKTGGLEQIKRVFRYCKKIGIATTAFFIVGLPGETKETLKETLDFAIQIDPDEINFTTATPFPGTELNKLMVSQGKIKGDEFENYRVYECLTDIQGMTSKEVQNELMKMYLSFYMRPSRLIGELIKNPLLFVKKSFSMLRYFTKRRK